MSKLPYVNALVCSADEYFRSKSDVISDMLLRHLQELSMQDDEPFSDHIRNDIKKLFVCLHQLISNLEPSSNVLWAAVKLIEKFCYNETNTTLVPMQNFIAPITDLLLCDLPDENKLRVLKILSELSRDMKIAEKDLFLPILTSKLTEFIMSEDVEVVRLSLLILVNICHNNPSVVYSLRSCIGGRFFRAVMNLQSGSIATKMLMCKLLFLLEPISLVVNGPPNISRTIIDATFLNLCEAYEKKEVFLLNSIVDFFKELTLSPSYVELLRSCDRSKDYPESLLHLMDGCDSETVYPIFNFVDALLELKIPALVPIYPQVVQICLQWLKAEKVTPKALNILTFIVLDMERDSSVSKSVLHLLDQYFQIFLQLYNIEMNGHKVCLVALLKFLQEILKFTELRNRLLKSIKVQECEKIFELLHSDYKADNHSEIGVILCIGALSFLSCLSKCNLSYLPLRDKLCSCSWIQRMLCTGLYQTETRCKVLTLLNTCTLPEECLSGMAKILSGNPCSEVPFDETNNGDTTSGSCMNFASFNLVKGSQVEELVGITMEKLNRNEVRDINISSVMSILEYRVSAATRTEQALYTNLDIARNFSSEMEGKLVEIDSRIQQMRNLLLKNQECVEYLQVEMQELKHIRELDEINKSKIEKRYQEELAHQERIKEKKQLQCKEMKLKIKYLSETKKELETNLTNVQEKIQDTSNAASKHLARLHTLDEEIKVQSAEYKELVEKNESMGNSLNEHMQTLSKQEAQAVDLKNENATLEKEISNLHMVNQALEQTAKEKDEEIRELKQEIDDLERLRDQIANISGRKKRGRIND